jgi:hypothetical protein
MHVNDVDESTCHIEALDLSRHTECTVIIHALPDETICVSSLSVYFYVELEQKW